MDWDTVDLEALKMRAAAAAQLELMERVGYAVKYWDPFLEKCIRDAAMVFDSHKFGMADETLTWIAGMDSATRWDNESERAQRP